MAVNYFSQSKGQRDMKAVKEIANEPRLDAGFTSSKSPEILSTFGTGMVVTGNIVCPGALQIYGRVNGDIQASHLVICEGAQVEGKIVAQDAVIQGTFSGTIYGNNVKLESTAVVDGEIFNKSLSIEQDALFEGMSRRLDKPVDPPVAPSLDHAVPATTLKPETVG
jgi:cytoskeletal protein CcmA (bactofilin family)